MFLGTEWTAFTSHLLPVFVFFMDSVKMERNCGEKALWKLKYLRRAETRQAEIVSSKEDTMYKLPSVARIFTDS